MLMFGLLPSLFFLSSKFASPPHSATSTEPQDVHALVIECSSSALAENLHHTKYQTTDSRRSSISSVLKRKDSLDSSTPELFQGIWEKELEENERKWKRLVRMSNSHVKSTGVPSDCVLEKSGPCVDGNADELIPGNLGPSDKNRKAVQSFSREGDHIHKSPGRNPVTDSSDCLSKIWDSFKSEADLSLTELDASFTGDPVGKSNHEDHHYLAQETELLSVESRIEKRPLRSPLPNPYDQPTSSKRAVVGLGLVDNTGSSSRQFDVASFARAYTHHATTDTSSSVVQSPKLKKLSLLSDKTFPTTSYASSNKVRKQSSTIPSLEIGAEDSFSRSSILDLSLVNAFPTPPKSQRSSLSSLASHNNKTPLSPRKNKARLSLIPYPDPIDRTHTEPTAVNGSTTCLAGRKSSIPTASDASLTNPQANNTTKLSCPAPVTLPAVNVRHPTSFSNRPRAQTGSVRAPAPAPLQIFPPRQVQPKVPSDIRRKSLGATTSRVGSANRPMRGPIHTKPLAPPPSLPLPVAPCPRSPSLNVGAEPRDSHHDHAHQYSPSSQLRLSPGGLSPGGLTTKRPSLVIRPKLTPSRSVGIYPTSPWKTSPSVLSSSPGIMSPVLAIKQDTASPCSSATTMRSFITDLHHDLVEQTRDTSQSTSSHTTCSSLSSSAGNSSVSTNSTIASPCTPSSSRFHSHNPVPPLSVYQSTHSPNFSQHRLGRVLLSPNALGPTSSLDPAHMLSTPRSTMKKAEHLQQPTPNTIRPPPPKHKGPCLALLDHRNLASTHRALYLAKNIMGPVHNSVVTQTDTLDQAESVSYGMAM